MTRPADPISPEPTPAGDFSGRPVLLIAGVAVLLCGLGFGWTLRGHFLGDDFGYVGRFFVYPLSQWPRLFVQSWAGDMWGFQLRELRPITALSFMLDARLWEGNAFGFRVVNLMLHASCAAMVGVLAWRAAARDLAAGIAAAALFSLHPAHAEPVQWITGRVDVLTTAFYLGGFLAFLRFRTAPTKWAGSVLIACYAAAAFSKEFGLTLPMMFLVADIVWLERGGKWREPATWKPYLGCLFVVVIYFFCRRAAFGAGGMGAAFPDLTSALFQLQFSQRQLTYLGHLFPPLERWWFDGAQALAQHAVRILILVTAGFGGALLAWRWMGRKEPPERRRGAIFFGLGWYLVATLPLVVTYISPRHLYLASAGICIALALVLRALTRLRSVFWILVAGLLVLFGRHLSSTMKPWHEAALVSGQIARQLRELEPDLRPGGALFLDVPEITAGAYVWTWAVPFALRPPFTKARLDESQVVLESRGLYVDWDRWHEQPAVAALGRVKAESWIVQAIGGAAPRRIPVSAEKVRAAAGSFAAAPLKQFPHESWRKLINDLTTP